MTLKFTVNGIDPSEYTEKVEFGVNEASAPYDQDEQRHDELVHWWIKTATQDSRRTVPKLFEYGTRDLTALGSFFAAQKGLDLTEEQEGIYGCLFYLVGKAARAVEALEQGRTPSEDTLFDLSVYATFARSYQERGEL